MLPLPFLAFPILSIVFLCLFVILQLILASAVFTDAQSLRTTTGRRGTFLVGPRVWWLATLLWGLVAVAIYWAIHHSTLRPPPVLPK